MSSGRDKHDYDLDAIVGAHSSLRTDTFDLDEE